MAAWMAYATLVGFLLAGAAHLGEWLLRAAGRPGRGAWAVALAGTLAVPAWMRWGPGAGGGISAGAAGVPTPGASSPLAALRALEPPSVLAALDPWLIGLWVVASLLLLAWLGGGLARVVLQARRWPRRRVAGQEVLVAPAFGPALLGLPRPRVVLPRWSLGLDADSLEMILLHEGEHARAGDALLLPAAALAVVMAPWNPALWWQLRRIRAALELDCDARVLARGVSPGRYGRLLLALGAERQRGSLAVAGLARPASLLERRLTTMVNGTKRGSPARRLGAAGIVLGLVILACEAPAPTTPATDVASEAAAPSPAPAVRIQGELEAMDPAPVFFVDGVRVDRLPELEPAEIERVEVMKGDAARAALVEDGGRGIVRVWTKSGAGGGTERPVATPARGEMAPAPARGGGAGAYFSEAPSSGERPAIYVDGRPFSGDPDGIDEATIASVRVRSGTDGSPDRIDITLKER
jgi:beta-lactamase regulating signal transducer with metallopeptidase domain